MEMLYATIIVIIIITRRKQRFINLINTLDNLQSAHEKIYSVFMMFKWRNITDDY